jgi:hypothetical protein
MKKGYAAVRGTFCVALLASTSLAFVIVACSDDSPSPSGSGTSTSSSGGSSGTNTSTGDAATPKTLPKVLIGNWYQDRDPAGNPIVVPQGEREPSDTFEFDGGTIRRDFITFVADGESASMDPKHNRFFSNGENDALTSDPVTVDSPTEFHTKVVIDRWGSQNVHSYEYVRYVGTLDPDGNGITVNKVCLSGSATCAPGAAATTIHYAKGCTTGADCCGQSVEFCGQGLCRHVQCYWDPSSSAVVDPNCMKHDAVCENLGTAGPSTCTQNVACPTSATPWGCMEGNAGTPSRPMCICRQNLTSAPAKSCAKSYSCCYVEGDENYKACSCSDDDPCPIFGGRRRVPSCPPP